ncbi:hypothetical protein [Sphingomonas oryzagri]|uniref:Isopropylmalate isomerase n=1 Tax=Sphingomonas oryzagri TaxID=3042314 RepID=A0ABT6MW58_9SPHN|nr:hypothetical protein [Sphingomonas oryzagri]MDH7637190.1 hypothetical protein [Sphingomonas oryzagri]
MAKKPTTDKAAKADLSATKIATIAAGATIGSAAIAAAVLFATRKRGTDEPKPAAKKTKAPSPVRVPPETD